MFKAVLTKPVLDPVTRRFLEQVNAQKGPALYELSPDEARQVLLNAQEIPVSRQPADIEDLTIPAPAGEVRLRIVKPRDVTAPLPAVVYFHGGGWILADRDTHDRLIREIANGAQAAVVFVDYDRSPEARFPTAIEQAYAAVRSVAENGQALGIDSSRLAVAGDSVGGNMAAVTALLAKERGGPGIGLQVLFYPVTSADFQTESYQTFREGYWLSAEAMKWFWNAYLPDERARRQPTASPLLASPEQLKGLPPALIITAECDVLRDEGETYARRLMEADIPTTALRFAGTIHDFAMLNALADTPAARGAIALACDTLRRSFSKPV